MSIWPTQRDLGGCVTDEELARLFDSAFRSLHREPRDPQGRRETPRIPVHDVKPIFLVSYAFDGPDCPLNLPAAIVDISADGLGIVLPRPLPVGAVVCFAFEDRTAGRSYGVALVVRVDGCEDGYAVGLTFMESAHSLDVEGSADEQPGTETLPRAHRPGFRRLREASALACRALASSNLSRRTVDTDVYGKKATFVAEAKLFRYQAGLSVDGVSIARRSGVLRDRLRSLVSDEALPTLVHLEGGGLSAWATFRPGAVMDCNLGFNVQLKQQICSTLLHR